MCSLIFSSHVFAARTNITLPKNQQWVHKFDTRTGSYSNVLARLYAVYPADGGKDNFRRIHVQVISGGEVIGNSVPMSNIHILNERSTSNTIIPLHEGTLHHRNVYFQFRGNSPEHAARAEVFYDAR